MQSDTNTNVQTLRITTTAEQALTEALQKASQPYITPELQIELDDFFNRCEYLFVGQLNPYELECFNKLCDLGLATRDYKHPAGILGLARVRSLVT